MFARAYIKFQYLCGYVPIDYNSPLANGSTRKPRNNLNESYYTILKQYTNNGEQGFLKTFLKDYSLVRKPEKYYLC